MVGFGGSQTPSPHDLFHAVQKLCALGRRAHVQGERFVIVESIHDRPGNLYSVGDFGFRKKAQGKGRMGKGRMEIVPLDRPATMSTLVS